MSADLALELDQLLDPARLAAAWLGARARPMVAPPAMPAPAPAPAEEPAVAAEPPPLPVAEAHRRFLDELVRTLAAAPGLTERARPVLSTYLAALAAAIDPSGGPLDGAAAEKLLDQLEDALQALLAAAGWPGGEEE